MLLMMVRRMMRMMFKTYSIFCLDPTHFCSPERLFPLLVTSLSSPPTEIQRETREERKKTDTESVSSLLLSVNYSKGNKPSILTVCGKENQLNNKKTPGFPREESAFLSLSLSVSPLSFPWVSLCEKYIWDFSCLSPDTFWLKWVVVATWLLGFWLLRISPVSLWETVYGMTFRFFRSYSLF